MKIRAEGYGYEWDAELIGGPCDGLLDRAVQLSGQEPPSYLGKILSLPMKRSKIGEKVMEDWQLAVLKGKEKVAVYELVEHDDDEDKCKYVYVETVEACDYQIKYLCDERPSQS
jgi:hypothetical protein